MAYTTANLNMMVQGVGDCPSWWNYKHTDVHTDVDESDYFTDGDAKGMRVGDVVLVSKSTTTVGTTVHYVSVVTSGGAATVAPAILA